MEDGEYDRELCGFTYRDVDERSRTCFMALRVLYKWLLTHRLDVMAWLIDQDYAHVGDELFPFNPSVGDGNDWHCTSLLGMAVFEVGAPAAVTSGW